jgi:cellulose synthase/poly-beta-1,6-N-acetylglucosamine synthase-like glycosyltransferase
MALRGADPQLATSLHRILEQDYPDFTLHVIVDNVLDPAFPIVQQTSQEFGSRMDATVLTDRLATCGLQCSAFIQASKRIADDVEIIVTVDGDLTPHETWLKELVSPFRDPQIGATFGNRWFIPKDCTYGGLVRYLWNAAAVVPMAIFNIPWGGCFAIRRIVFDQSGMADKWSKAIVHDAPAQECLKQMGLKIHFVPCLMMVIRDNCSLRFCFDFIKRQLTWTRIYHSSWWVIVLHALVVCMLWMVAIAIAIYGIVKSDWNTAIVAGVGMTGYAAVMCSMVGMLEHSVRKSLARRKEFNCKWMNWSTLLKIPIAFVLAHAIHFIAVLLANQLQQVTWRGVTYRLRGPWDIELQTDGPFETTTKDASL